MGGLLSGASYPLRAVGVLRRTPGLWPFVAVPVVLNILVGIAVYAGLLFTGLHAIDALVTGLPEWAVLFAWLLRALLVGGLLLATGFVIGRFGVVLGSPWYSVLAGRLERQVLGDAAVQEPGGIRGALTDLGRAVRYELKKLVLVTSVSVLLLAMNVVPVLGTVAASVGGIALGVVVACLDFFDAPLERRRLHFRQKLGVIRRAMPASLGFGLVCFVLVGIPFLNLFAIPLCMTAGTLFFCDRIAAQLPTRSPTLPTGRSRSSRRVM